MSPHIASFSSCISFFLVRLLFPCISIHEGSLLLDAPCMSPPPCFLFLVHLLFPCISIHEGSLLLDALPCIPIHEGSLLLDAPCMSPHIASFSSCISSFRASPYMKAPSSYMPHVWAHTLLPFPRAEGTKSRSYKNMEVPRKWCRGY